MAKYESMCYDEAGALLIVDEYKENLIKDLVQTEEITRQLANNAPNLSALLMMAKVNAILNSRKNG